MATVGITQPDRAILDVLVDTENLILSDLSRYCAEVLRDRPSGEIETLQRFYERGVNATTPEDARDFRVKKFLGFPRTAVHLPAWGITIQTAQEVRKGFGNLVADEEEYSIYGSHFSGRFAVNCYSDNAELTTSLQSVALWALLTNRDLLETTYGLFNQGVTLSDFSPPPEAAPEFAFFRSVVLSCEYENTWRVAKEPIEGFTYDDLSAEEPPAGDGVHFNDVNGNQII